ncbi:MAG: glutamine synthetase III [Deferribacterales bacterium]|nr:glutamine synthetase III [Deferribacterales bacterium]
MMNFRKTAFNAISSRPVKQCTDNRAAIADIYGCNVFSERVMRERLPKDVFKRLQKTMNNKEKLDPSLADIVANAMKDWAVSLGATHYTHWFQSMTGQTAEKHDAFTSLAANGQVISEFSGKMLIKGESDASSFPSGGIRSTFEARGYTAWDPTSPAFINETKYGKILCIPTVFLSYTGEALDRKVPLMKSVEAVSKQTMRILRLFGSKATDIVNTIGAEQEYFLIDREFYLQRPDLISTGRTLYGAKATKGQDLEDHYYGAIPSRVLAFMTDAEERLFKLGVPVKTRHNEVAPAQYEIACVYESANIASDHNIMVMNVLKETAKEHNFICLLHEKPFASVNGSGKHNNWSLADSDGNNLLEPGDTPQENAQFLIFLASFLRAVHKYAVAFRLGIVSASNDHRLGGNEAPPAIISVFLGTQLGEVVHNIIYNRDSHKNHGGSIDLGILTLPPLPMDTTDRNRTSPMAFTGNKFEFRASGSSQPVAQAVFAMNAAVACAMDDVATALEDAMIAGADFNQAVRDVLVSFFREHEAIIYNGDNYSKEWLEEAEKRGLPNLNNSVDAIKRFTDPDIVEMFTRFNILSEKEIPARQEILFESYAKTIAIEARSASHIGRNIILPVCIDYQTKLASNICSLREALGDEAEISVQKELLKDISLHVTELKKNLDNLDNTMKSIAETKESTGHRCIRYRDEILVIMEKCRFHADILELLVDDKYWPLPRYQEIFWIH